ncbi:hypothetical protein [Robertkochia flava]|uniref:hypothetical protein n=1 Tax=Robertkochia flava TaxID=3447986 RepID=UPI001CCA0084|nr:hypothetical protein [Robertkochia marina]
MILVFKYFFRGKYVGLALWPFIFLKSRDLKEDQVLMNHERIHLRQQLELLVLLFYLWYVLEWFYHLLATGDAYRAYKMVSFEKEAYRYEGDAGYLASRKPWAFLRFLHE